MSVDDPIEAAEAVVANERRTDSALARFAGNLSEIADVLPVESIAALGPMAGAAFAGLKAFGGYVRRLEGERRQYLVDVLKEELLRVRAKVEHLDDAFQAFVEQDFLPLVLDGLQMAEQTRSKEKIRRLAKVLAHAVEFGPQAKADQTEEMMRVAAALSDEEVQLLGAIYSGQIQHYQVNGGRVDPESANNFWANVDAAGYPQPNAANPVTHWSNAGRVQSICAKLQSFGLITQVSPNRMKVSPGGIPYALLQNGKDFIEYIRGSAEGD
jgi:hypothetical protein